MGGPCPALPRLELYALPSSLPPRRLIRPPSAHQGSSGEFAHDGTLIPFFLAAAGIDLIQKLLHADVIVGAIMARGFLPSLSQSPTKHPLFLALACEMWPSNTADVTSLVPVIDRLRRRFLLLRDIRGAQEHLVEIADRPATAETTAPSAPTIEQFLSGLRTVWQEGEVRPTNKPKAKAPRGRRRPDPLAKVTELLREWFEAEPWRTSRELFERLQEAHPGLFPDGQLRTLQRRVKTWRHVLAHKMVFGAAAVGEISGQSIAARLTKTPGSTACSCCAPTPISIRWPCNGCLIPICGSAAMPDSIRARPVMLCVALSSSIVRARSATAPSRTKASVRRA